MLGTCARWSTVQIGMLSGELQGIGSAALRSILVGLLFLFAFGISGCKPPPAPGVVIVVFDSTRRDDTSYLEPELGYTPRLDALAAKGLRFSQARSLYTWTVPAHISLFTGCEVAEGAYQAAPVRGGGSCDQRAASIFGMLGAHGYRTYAYSANSSLRRDTVDALADVGHSLTRKHEMRAPEDVDAVLLHYGGNVQDINKLPPKQRREYQRRRLFLRRSARAITSAAVQALDRHVSETPERPFLLFVNYNDGHDPYHPEPPYDEFSQSPGASSFNGDLWDPERRNQEMQIRGRALSTVATGLSPADLLRARDLHRGEIAFVDHHLGVLLDELKRLKLFERTAIIVTSDHGEAFGEDGRMAHGGDDLDVLLDVPLVMMLPGISSARIDTPVDHRDIKPTLMAYLGLPDTLARGRNLLPLLKDGSLPISNEGQPTSPSSLSPIDPERQKALEEELRFLGYIE